MDGIDPAGAVFWLIVFLSALAAASNFDERRKRGG